jgi:hypothetical protein
VNYPSALAIPSGRGDGIAAVMPFAESSHLQGFTRAADAGAEIIAGLITLGPAN